MSDDRTGAILREHERMEQRIGELGKPPRGSGVKRISTRAPQIRKGGSR